MTRIPKIWNNGDVWILGGGSSVAEQFAIPNDIVDKARIEKKPSILSPYLAFLHDKHVIGVNAAYQLGSWVNMVVFGDSGFFLRNQEQLQLFPGLIVSLSPNTSGFKWVKTLNRDPRQVKGICSHPSLVSWNFNSGAAAINVAAHTGAKRIFLLGFDMNRVNDETHWHSQYDGKTTASTFNRHLKCFDAILNDSKKMGIEIINVNPDSAINQFPKRNLKDIINEY